MIERCEIKPIAYDEVSPFPHNIFVYAVNVNLEASGAQIQMPCTIENIADLPDLFWLSGQILPFRLCNEVVVSNSSQEYLAATKKKGEGLLINFLDKYGYWHILTPL